MRSRKTTHRFYRIALYLYPKSYRREYGDQMVQTLQDMLDDTGGSLSRATIWLRIAAEMPLSIIKENSSNIGDNSMNKLANISNKRLRIGGIAIAIVLLIAACGVWRNNIAAGLAKMAYLHSLRDLTVSQNNSLSHPFVRFAGNDPKLMSTCAAWRPNALQMHVGCDATLQTYVKLGQTAADKAKVLQSVDAITAALKTEGYQAGSNGVTLSSLVAGTYEGKDFSPDAAYQKATGKDLCLFQVSIAYSNPAAPAINVMLGCSRTLYPLGKS